MILGLVKPNSIIAKSNSTMKKVYVITSLKEFNETFHYLEEAARIDSTPNIFMVGIDVEMINKTNHKSFKDIGKWIENPDCSIAVCTIQIAVDDMCFIYHLPKMGKPLPKKLSNLLINDSWIKGGIGVSNDLKHLSHNYNLGHCGGEIEIKNIALLGNINNPNLAHLSRKILGINLLKDSTSADWSQDLSVDMIEYASRDAMVSYKILKKCMEPTLKYLHKSIHETPFNMTIIKSSDSDNDKDSEDWVSRLNIYLSRHPHIDVEYSLQSESETYPKEYEIRAVLIDDREGVIEKKYGSAGSKKKAKQIAAHKMYGFIGHE